MFNNQYEEHLADSAPCNSRWDGFDRGDNGDDGIFASKVIGRMTNPKGKRVEIIEEYADGDIFHKVLVNGECVFFDENSRAYAVILARGLYNA